MVCELHFARKQHLAVDVPWQLMASAVPDFVLWQDNIPPLLLACRTIRAEAIPIFSSKLTIHIYRGLDRNTQRRQIRATAALAHYLTSSPTLVVHDFGRDSYQGKLELPRMPALKVLRFFVYHHKIGQASVSRDHAQEYAVRARWYREIGMLALRESGIVEPGVRVFAELSGKCAYLGRAGSG
jgi:hypothetical protein